MIINGTSGNDKLFGTSRDDSLYGLLGMMNFMRGMVMICWRGEKVMMRSMVAVIVVVNLVVVAVIRPVMQKRQMQSL